MDILKSVTGKAFGSFFDMPKSLLRIADVYHSFLIIFGSKCQKCHPDWLANALPVTFLNMRFRYVEKWILPRKTNVFEIVKTHVGKRYRQSVCEPFLGHFDQKVARKHFACNVFMMVFGTSLKRFACNVFRRVENALWKTLQQ